MREGFRRFANWTAEKTGSPGVFLTSVLVIAIWAATGPAYHYSDSWQLVMNTGTSIVTFLMVFLIQATQNRDAKAMHLKLNELIRAVTEARNKMMSLEDAPEEMITELKEEFSILQEEAVKKVEKMKAGEPKR